MVHAPVSFSAMTHGLFVSEDGGGKWREIRGTLATKTSAAFGAHKVVALIPTGITRARLSELTIPESPTGFQIIKFATPQTGLASPVFRSKYGIIEKT